MAESRGSMVSSASSSKDSERLPLSQTPKLIQRSPSALPDTMASFLK